MYWIAIGVGIATLLGGWLHSRYDAKPENRQHTTHA